MPWILQMQGTGSHVERTGHHLESKMGWCRPPTGSRQRLRWSENGNDGAGSRQWGQTGEPALPHSEARGSGYKGENEESAVEKEVLGAGRRPAAWRQSSKPFCWALDISLTLLLNCAT